MYFVSYYFPQISIEERTKRRWGRRDGDGSGSGSAVHTETKVGLLRGYSRSWAYLPGPGAHSHSPSRTLPSSSSPQQSTLSCRLLDQITLFWRIFQTLTIVYPLMTVLLWELHLNPRHTKDRVQSPAGSYSSVLNL